jgi:hypothetical protein
MGKAREVPMNLAVKVSRRLRDCFRREGEG